MDFEEEEEQEDEEHCPNCGAWLRLESSKVICTGGCGWSHYI